MTRCFILDRIGFHISTAHRHCSCRLYARRLLVAFAIAASFAALDLWIGSQAGAAQVDAKGAPAPVGFADVIERVKATVVGVRANFEGGTLPGEPNEDIPFSPESPLERFFPSIWYSNPA